MAMNLFVGDLLVGGLLLAFGRRLFWLFVAACGFAVGLRLTDRFVGTRSDWLNLIVALAVGVLGALLALFFQHLAIGVAGFFAGALIAVRLLDSLGFQGDVLFWMALVIGGVLGSVLMKIVFDWSLIGLSSLAGSSVIVEALRLKGAPGFLLWLVLIGLGVAVQAAQTRHTV
jgi:hypothetical protein